jgi:putative sugar O-methyltransferase
MVAMRSPAVHIEDDLVLLETMLSDADLQSALYHPGPYWQATARAAAREIKAHGLSDFRGTSNLIGLSFTDSVLIDWRKHLTNGGPVRKVVGWITNNVFPISKIYQNQVNLTEAYFSRATLFAEEILKSGTRTTYLLTKYKIPYSLLGGCVAKAKISNEEIAVLYLNMLSQHDYAAQFVDFGKVTSVFEIGGGFGANIHLLLTNYPNIRKVIYLDIPPNLYVGTQYLKAFFGSSVINYREIKRRRSLAFAADSRLEILCIAPWQIELFEKEVDILLNSASFVEMPKAVVQNYADKAVCRFGTEETAIVLTSYDRFDLSTTFHPDELPTFFGTRTDFTKLSIESLGWPARKEFIYISPGKFGNQGISTAEGLSKAG